MSNTADKASEQPQQQKPQVLEEDDEFEDFPVEGTSHAIFSRIRDRDIALEIREHIANYCIC